MKHLCTILATVFAATFSASAKTFDWPIDSPAAGARQFAAYHGETVRFNLQFRGAMTNLSPVAIYYQTNGMGRAEWFGPVPGTVFHPTNDCGAAAYRFFILCNDPDGKDYTANGSLRLLDSPGFEPSAVQLPAQSLDFARIEVLNPPWGEGPGNYAAVSNAAMNAAQNATNCTDRLEDSLKQGFVVVEQANNATYAGTAYEANMALGAFSLSDGSGNDRSGAAIFAQLDAATETNAAQTAALASLSSRLSQVSRDSTNYTDSAIAAASTNYATRAELEAGWWSEWKQSPGGPYVFTLEWDSGSHRWKAIAQGYGALVMPAEYGENAVELTPDTLVEDVLYTFTRHRVAAPVPTKAADIGAADTNTVAAVRSVAAAATATNAAQQAALSTHASQLSQQSQSISTLGSQVSAIGAHLNAEDARLVSTNYNSATHMPEAYVEVKITENGESSWLTVWREMTRWDWFLGIYTNQYAELSAALANKGEREYAFYDGVTGEPAPDGFFWIAQPRVAFAAGMSYQRYVDTGGAVWVLESNGMVADVNGTTNGFFRISDDEGNTQFEIVKGSSRPVVAVPGAMSRTTVVGVSHWHTTYAVTNAASAPVAMFCRDLASPEWHAETDGDCPCNVSWTNPESGVYVCEWWAKGTEPKMFMKTVYGQGTESRIVQSAPVEMQYIVVNGVKYTLGTATISGSTVLTLTPVSH